MFIQALFTSVPLFYVDNTPLQRILCSKGLRHKSAQIQVR